MWGSEPGQHVGKPGLGLSPSLLPDSCVAFRNLLFSVNFCLFKDELSVFNNAGTSSPSGFTWWH